MAYTETRALGVGIAEGSRLHSNLPRARSALFALWISVNFAVGVEQNHWSFYLLLAAAALGRCFHYRLKALCDSSLEMGRRGSRRHTGPRTEAQRSRA